MRRDLDGADVVSVMDEPDVTGRLAASHRLKEVMQPTDPAYAGQHFYSPAFLKIYDPFVLGLYATWVWRCPTRLLVEHYSRHIGRRHLDVGPGTGYFLQHASLPANLDLLLLDPNADVLEHASRRLRHLKPRVLRA